MEDHYADVIMWGSARICFFVSGEFVKKVDKCPVGYGIRKGKPGPPVVGLSGSDGHLGL
jgi:hypothetical protein